MKSLNLFSFFKSDIWFKSSGDWHKVLFIIYIYSLQSIYKTTPSCASMLLWFIYRAFLKWTWSFINLLLTSEIHLLLSIKKIQIYRF